VAFGDLAQLPEYIAATADASLSASILQSLGKQPNIRTVKLGEKLTIGSVMLNIGYRMPAHSTAIDSKLFYDGKVTAFDQSTRAATHWLDVAGRSQREGTSAYNFDEKEKIRELLRDLRQPHKHGENADIVIITLYEAQRKQLAELNGMKYKV
jgi:superfamily I DNA and/or RNA helicase